MKILRIVLIVLWNTFSVLLLLALKIISIILILPIYIIMLLLALFSPITYLISFLSGILFIGGIAYCVTEHERLTGGIFNTIIFCAVFTIPLIISGSVSLFGDEAAAGLIGFLGSIVTLPFNCLFISF